MLLSICITSYNRPKELERCLRSIDVSDSNKIQIIISEDVSPKREEIRKVIKDFSKESRYSIIPNFNEKNLGYDRNLGKLISLSAGDYILLCSDDDAFVPHQLDCLIEICENNEYAMILSSYLSNDSFAFNRKYNHNFQITSGERQAAQHLYDGILFSGLVFKRNIIQDLDAEKFVNTNYFQIYLLLKTLNAYGGYYMKNPLINCIGDGENGYGTTELSEYDPLLSDRGSLYSNMRFNQGLIKVIRMFDAEEGTHIIQYFESEYSRKTYRGLSKARRIGKDELKKYWNELNKLDIKIIPPANIYFGMLNVLGANICDHLIEIPKKILFIMRRYGC